MPDREESRRTALRAVAAARSENDDTTVALREALGALESKLATAGGVTRVAEWLRRTERLLEGVSDAQIERTRREIRELIDHLLELNAQIQTLVRLKRMF
jgi:hypothetical protein